MILLLFCTFVPTGDRLPILTPSLRPHDIDLIGDFGLSPGSKLDAERGVKHRRRITAGSRRHFASLTSGRYERLIVDYDTAGRTVLLAIRDIGTECPVEALSERARDQLYLALRVAAVEAYAAQAEPLPFIADDLLVHFDDTRTTAAITLLAELGQTTQVILFTHHDHIVELAERQAGVAVQALPPITAVLLPSSLSPEHSLPG